MKEFLQLNIKSFICPYIFTITVFNLIIIQLPLTNTIDYEFSALNAILFFFISGYMIIHYSNNHNFLTIIISLKYKIIILLGIPLLIGLISNLIINHCPITNGIVYYLIISIPSFFFGTISGIFIINLTKKLRYVIFTFIAVIILLSPLIEFYFNPQLYFYNPIIGFYKGTIYDEELSFNHYLISYRLLNIAFFIGLFFYQNKYKKKI